MDPVVVVVISLFTLLACALFAVTALARRSGLAWRREGMGEWAVGLGMQCLAWPLFAVQQGPWASWTQAAGCGLLVAGYAAIGRAFLRSMRDRVPGWYAYAPALLLTAALLAPSLHAALRIALFWLFALVTMGLFVPSLLRQFRGTVPWSQRVVVAVLIGAPLVAAYRLGEQTLWPSVGPDFASALQPSQVAALAYYLLAPVFATFAFVLLQQERQRAWLEGLAAQDPLTGINNRRAFSERAAQVDGRRGSGRDARLVALLMIDIDNFKAINDVHGHAAGDALLVVVARALQKALHGDDVAGRLGGDEFCGLMVDVAVGEAVERADRLRQFVAAHPLRLGSKSIAASISIGIACARADRALDLDALLSSADRRLYLAKRTGRNRVISTDPQLDDLVDARAGDLERVAS